MTAPPDTDELTAQLEAMLRQRQPVDEPTSADVAESPAQSAVERLRAHLVTTEGLDDIPDPEPLIEGIIDRDGLVWLVGKPGHGKSFVALDMAGCIATGQSWQGHPTTGGTVLYVAAEGVRGTKPRVRAWESAMGTPMTGVAWLTVAPQAADGVDWGALIEIAAPRRDALIVLDTQARVTVGIEENSNTEMGRFVHRVEQLRAATGATVMIVHHIGRQGETGRGATTLDGAMNTIIRVDKDADTVKITCQKQKDGPEFGDILLRVVPTGDSATLMPSDGRSASLASLLPTARQWWGAYAGDWISISRLAEAIGGSPSTASRHALGLCQANLAEREGRGAARSDGTPQRWEYRLLGEPPAG